MTVLVVAPVEILTGISFGLLVGIVGAALVGCVSFVTAFAADETVPELAGGAAAVVLTGVALFVAGVVDLETIQPGLLLGLGLVFVLGLYATSWGTQLAATLPRSTAGPIERTQPLAADAIDAVDAMGQVTIRPSGGVREFEGYPPLGPELQSALEDGAWRLPADLPLSELETRLETTLQSTYDLEAVAVAVDGRGRATITAAPPANGVAKGVPEGWRAVSVRTLLPTGLAPGDDVLAATGSTTVSGTVLSATVDVAADESRPGPVSATIDEPSSADRSGAGDRDPTSDAVAGGEGRVTLAVPTTDADTLLDTDRATVVVTPRGATHESDAISLLERGEVLIQKTTLTEAVLDTVSDAETDLEVFAIRGSDAIDDAYEHEWQFEPDPETLTVGSEVFLFGSEAGVVDSEPAEADPVVFEVSH